jgi:flagellar protein FlaG
MEISPIAGPGARITEPAAPVSEEQRMLLHAIRAVNSAEMFGQDNELTFVVDRHTRRALVRIVNRETGEVVRQIPAEYVLRIAEELSRG